MINFYNQVPSVYTHVSRDFQYLSWLINIVLNSVKHNVDDLYDLPNAKADPRLTELLAMTLGFKVKRKYDQKQLATIVSILPRILRYKGTKEAVTLVGKALISTSGAIGMFKCELKDNCVEVVLPETLVDTTLFMDLLPYILPAGITCRVVRNTQTKGTINDIIVKYQDTLQAKVRKDLDWDETNQGTTGLANMFNINSATTPNFANFEGSLLNVGLLDNTIIPTIENPLLSSLNKPLNTDYSEEPNAHGTTVIINNYSAEDNDSGTTAHIGGK